MSIWLLATVCLGPFLFGCVEPWSSGLLEMSLFSLAAVLAFTRPFRWSEVPPLTWGMLGLAVLAAVQARHPAHAITAVTGPVTSSRWATTEAGRLWAAYACLIWTAAAVAQSRRRASIAAWALFAMGTIISVIGIVQMGSGAETFYGIRPIPDGFMPFGPYYYKNHAGGLLVMTFAVGAGLIWARAAGYRGSRRVGALATLWTTQVFLLCLLALQGFAIWLCESRGAIHSLAIAGVGTGVVGAFGFAPRRTRNRWFVTLLICVATYVALAVAFPRLADMKENSGAFRGSFAMRVRIWEAAWPMVKLRPVWGYGLGAFEYAFAPFQAAYATDIPAPVDHAHAEWLELLVGGGAVAGAILGLGLLLQIVSQIRAWWAWDEPGIRPLLGGALAAMITFLAHASAELNLASPANAAVFLLTAGLIFRPRPRGDMRRREEASQERTGWPGRAALVALALWGTWSTARMLGGWWCAHRAVDGDLAARAALYERALGYAPGHPGYERELGVALLWLGDENIVARRLFARQALAAAARGLKGTPDHAGLAEVAGTALWWTGREKDGAQFLAVAAALRPWRRARRPWVRVVH
ncbi:MAG: O-antigen ligase family protein [Candidatus Coatesbacteria bacterium]